MTQIHGANNKTILPENPVKHRFIHQINFAMADCSNPDVYCNHNPNFQVFEEISEHYCNILIIDEAFSEGKNYLCLFLSLSLSVRCMCSCCVIM